jgi:hypothetical protein
MEKIFNNLLVFPDVVIDKSDLFAANPVAERQNVFRTQSRSHKLLRLVGEPCNYINL